MFYIEESNPNAYSIQVAFIALDAQNLGELVNDKYYTDFGDNKFPYYRGNTNVRLDYKKYVSRCPQFLRPNQDFHSPLPSIVGLTGLPT